MAQRMAKQWRKEKRSMAARSVEKDGDRPVLCSSQVDSLRTVLSIHGDIYTSLLFVHMWLDQQVIKSVKGKWSMRHWPVRHGLDAYDVIPGLCAWSMR